MRLRLLKTVDILQMGYDGVEQAIPGLGRPQGRGGGRSRDCERLPLQGRSVARELGGEFGSVEQISCGNIKQ